jgi:hypothetical protein
MIGKHSGNLIAEASETPPGNIGKLSDTQTDHLQVSGGKREVVSFFVEFEAAVPRLTPAFW